MSSFKSNENIHKKGEAVFVEANAMNSSESFRFIALIASKELIFLNIFRKFSLSVAMTTKEIVRFAQKFMSGTRPLNKHF